MAKTSVLKTLDRSLQILLLFDTEQPEWGVTELARRLDLPKSIVQKTLATFARHGILYRQAVSRRYRLGPRLLSLARGAESELAELVKPAMLPLANATQETVKLTIVDGYETVIAAAVESPQSLRMTGRVGERNPLHKGASNKVLAAYLPKTDVAAAVHFYYSAQGRPEAADHVLARLWPELERIAQAGWATSTGEREAGVKAIAVPLGGPRGRMLGCLSIVGPSSRMAPERDARLLQLLQETADRLAAALGWTIGESEGASGDVRLGKQAPQPTRARVPNVERGDAMAQARGSQ